ncbi:single-stranded-DNA-specific exonuclease RecJ family protein [Pyrococcus yayanosii]|uniref:DHH family phosphoesterase n=1 Tax=Pyrococcus yayanosii TaxID=1008460 RepID=UPI00064F3353|nr:DHH family phosphoesterase [Pyrococcus yayanosii]
MALIIHHWDTDGITTAALLVRALELGDFKNMTPPIGEFRFDGKIWAAIERADKLYVLDLNLPQEVEKVPVETLFIDHHIQPRIKNPRVRQVNPALEGKHYPSASLVVSEHFGIFNAWSALGAVGDIGEKAFELSRVEELLKGEGLSREDALKLVELIDSNYIVMDRMAVEEALHVLLNYELRELLEYEPWIRRVEAIKEAVEEVMSSVEERNGFAIVDFESPFNIISKVARKLVWEKGYRGAVVVNRNFHGKAQVYFRVSPKEAERISVLTIIGKLRGLGVNAGGKREVIGCICERGKLDEVLSVIDAYLG